mmetsp:Transcript_22009/g.37127  ORF Transcript_22009/g.37127 Transcript_22009/m.37127 type:complete len:456 (+) Transcript_22009:106-1473(+)|eukprot:CAMPEP_0174971028 /NCGR_PEP_ID=MMETSP0004_2-20121128/9748_1 /TAXON_ID=420556 /ORGANISM="Ochromonas sp., Strain CCMP1393" /LENGTH=455 /DNA_ID=CAMNT_0016220899 /DNA_START=74 /DNA_END=1441 /DNA_ORIENTATION=+
MPPKVFKAPDGTEFTSKAQWRDYMMLTYYSFKNKVNEPEPLIKTPGSIEGQMFDIADCEGSTLVVMDHTEQVQVDQLKNCRVFIAACASSIFIRNCENCTFYTSCRQLRLREVVNCNFYIFSQAEVHIEFSTKLRFAPFNGGYPEHAEHMKSANLDVSHNLWYDIYDHNDPGKTRENWGLIPEAEYEAPWFPAGPCEPAIPRTKPGGVANPAGGGVGGEGEQAFGLQQMMADAEKQKAAAAAGAVPSSVSTSLEQAASVRAATPKKPAPKLPPTGNTPAPPIPPLPAGEVPATPANTMTTGAAATPAVTGTATAAAEVAGGSAADKINDVLKLLVGYKAGEDISAIAHPSFSMILGNGQTLGLSDMSVVASTTGNEMWTVERLEVCDSGSLAYASYWATVDVAPDADPALVAEGGVAHCTAVLQKVPGSFFEWMVVHVQQSITRPVSAAPPPFYA